MSSSSSSAFHSSGSNSASSEFDLSSSVQAQTRRSVTALRITEEPDSDNSRIEPFSPSLSSPVSVPPALFIPSHSRSNSSADPLGPITPSTPQPPPQSRMFYRIPRGSNSTPASPPPSSASLAAPNRSSRSASKGSSPQVTRIAVHAPPSFSLDPESTTASNESDSLAASLLPQPFNSSAVMNSLFSPCIFYPIPPETMFFIQYFPGILNTPASNRSLYSQLLNRIFVCPLANLTNFSLSYQLYLAEIFHTKFLTKLSHYTCMPIVNVFIAVFLSQFSLALALPIGMAGSSAAVELSGGALYCVMLLLWYLVWGIISSIPILGPLMAPILLFIHAFSQFLASTCMIPQSNAPWYNPTLSAFSNPLIWMFFTAFWQALGHIAEPRLPPRVSGTTEWLDYDQAYELCGSVRFYIRCVSQVLFGTFDEFIASPRLLPILTIRIYFALGFGDAYWKPIKKVVDLAMESGNPALDFIGIGGDLSIQQAIKHDKELKSVMPIDGPDKPDQSAAF